MFLFYFLNLLLIYWVSWADLRMHHGTPVAYYLNGHCSSLYWICITFLGNGGGSTQTYPFKKVESRTYLLLTSALANSLSSLYLLVELLHPNLIPSLLQWSLVFWTLTFSEGRKGNFIILGSLALARSKSLALYLTSNKHHWLMKIRRKISTFTTVIKEDLRKVRYKSVKWRDIFKEDQSSC